MSGLVSGWLNYFDRSYQQIKASVLTRQQARVPEITDDTEGNLYVKIIDVYGGIGEMLGYYIDNAAREAFIDSLRNYSSAIHLASLMDYRIRVYSPSSTTETFTLSGITGTDVLIPEGTEVDAPGPIPFITVEDLTIPTGQTVGNVSVKQYSAVTSTVLGTSDGSTDQQYVVNGNLVDGSMSIIINSQVWLQVETFAYSLPTDNHYIVTLNANQQIVVIFGDGMGGAIPGSTFDINATYRTTSGTTGRADGGTITTIVSTITLPTGITLSATNANTATGGSDIESLDDIKRRIPLYLRTGLRAVSTQDYIDVAELLSGVVLAGVDFSCGKTVNVYVVPDGGGIADPTLLSDVETWFDDKRMITTAINAQSVGEVHILQNWDLYVLPGYSRSATVALAASNMETFLSYQEQKINGQVEIGDLYQIMENTDGIDYGVLNSFVARPYATPVGTTASVLLWIRAVSNLSTAKIVWTVTFITPTKYQLLKAGVYKGQFNTGAAVHFDEIDFNISANGYNTNDRFMFTTYPYNISIQLSEPSLAVAISADLTLIGHGGN